MDKEAIPLNRRIRRKIVAAMETAGVRDQWTDRQVDTLTKWRQRFLRSRLKHSRGNPQPDFVPRVMKGEHLHSFNPEVVFDRAAARVAYRLLSRGRAYFLLGQINDNEGVNDPEIDNFMRRVLNNHQQSP